MLLLRLPGVSVGGEVSRHATDMTGQRFGRLTILRRAESNAPGGKARWVCLCDCGTEKTLIGADIRIGQRKSCGCLRRELPGRAPRHGVPQAVLDRYTPLEAILERKTVRVARALLGFDGVTCSDLLDAIGVDIDSNARGSWYMALGYMARGGHLDRGGGLYRITPAGRSWLANQLAKADPGVATDEEAAEGREEAA